MIKQSFERFAATSILLLVLITIFFAKDKFNFLSYSSNPPLAEVRENKIEQIVIDDNISVTQLINKNNVWYVKNNHLEYKANQENIKKLLTSVSNLKKNEVATNDKQEYEKLGIDTKKIIITSPDQTFAIYIGNPTNLSRNYVRIDEDNKIYMAEGFTEVFTNEYRDMTIGLVHNENMVRSVEITDTISSIKIELVDGDWLINNKKIEKEKVSFYLNDLKTIQTQVVDLDSKEFSDPDLIVKVTEGNQTREAEFFYQDDTNLVKVTDHDEVLKIDLATLAAIKKTSEDFLN